MICYIIYHVQTKPPEECASINHQSAKVNYLNCRRLYVVFLFHLRSNISWLLKAHFVPMTVLLTVTKGFKTSIVAINDVRVDVYWPTVHMYIPETIQGNTFIPCNKHLDMAGILSKIVQRLA